MSDQRAIRHHRAGTWQGEVLSSITLSKDMRFRRRIALVSDDGQRFLLDLPQAVSLCEGDALELEDGRLIRVVSQAEDLLEVRGHDPHHLLVLAWHLGNRHLEAELSTDRILIRRDHVIADMLIGLGATVAPVRAPFQPEGGAYDHASGGARAPGHGQHGHHGHHGHDHD